ncbi:YbjQ family protein [Aminipila sp.]|uniref:YbjQ family protein n=1 Tax=Aminipila sp. TaxID=2060095 RepID=UPI002899645D|nr:YbjQ family protein [Aminipila sp.]
MLLVNINHIPGKDIEVLGIVKGNVVQSKNVGRDIMAGVKGLVGGELTGYTEMLTEAREIATKRMINEAEKMGADAILQVQFSSAAIMQGAAEIIAYGTAVKYK